MANIEKSDFAKLYTRITGLTVDVDELIASVAPEDKATLYKKLSWQIKRGCLLDGEEWKKMYSEFLPALAEKLGIDVTLDDVDGDGDVDADDEKIKNDLSGVTIVTKEPTTEPTTEEPSEGEGTTDDSDVIPTEEPTTEEPTEDTGSDD